MDCVLGLLCGGVGAAAESCFGNAKKASHELVVTRLFILETGLEPVQVAPLDP